MRSNYRPIGNYIHLVDERNKELRISTLLGLSISKDFIPSVANTIGTNMRNYKIIRKNQFACSIMQVRRDGKMPVALLEDIEEAIISQAYPVFEIIDTEVLLPQYLMMWFSRSEFDRQATFHAVGGVRGSLEWEDFLAFELPVPSIEKQREIVREYNVIKNRIELNIQLNQKLEKTAQALYKHWFVDFEFPNVEGKPYKSSEGTMVFNEELNKEIPEEWKKTSLKCLCQKIASGATPKGGKQSYRNRGISLIRSMNVYDYYFSENNLAFINEDQANKLKNVTVQANDILFNITGASVARCCIVPSQVLPARINQHVMLIRTRNKNILNSFLLYTLCSIEAKKQLIGISEAGSTRQAITKSEIENFEVIYPKKEILLDFERSVKPIMKKRSNNVRINNKLIRLQNLLLSRMARLEEEKEIV